MTRTAILALVGFALVGHNTPANAECTGDPEFCPPSNNCWDDDVGIDTCVDPPPPCSFPAVPAFQFSDNLDGSNDGQLVVLGNSTGPACGTLTTNVTGYYSIFDTALAESCASQVDETGYLTITNSCNTAGWAEERNAGDRYVVIDSDNSTACGGDGDCGPGKRCRSDGACCVPSEPTFMGTFLLVAGESNTICIHHWCPDWRAELAGGTNYGFVVGGCEGSINSIHFIVSEALACEDVVTLHECGWGCSAGECPPDPCDSAECPLYCMDGVCLDDNPCDSLECAYGCVNGYCLQEPDAPGEDADGDGYSSVADCDDHDAAVNPGHVEVCDNDSDDDCDGLFDEADCQRDGAGADGVVSGCGCRAGDTTSGAGGVLLLLLVAGVLARRRRRALGCTHTAALDRQSPCFAGSLMVRTQVCQRTSRIAGQDRM